MFTAKPNKPPTRSSGPTLGAQHHPWATTAQATGAPVGTPTGDGPLRAVMRAVGRPDSRPSSSSPGGCIPCATQSGVVMRMCSPGGWAPGPDSTTKPPVGAGRRLLLPAAQRVQVGPGWLQALLAAVLLCCSMLQGHAQGGRVVMQPWGLSAPQGAHAPARTPAYDFFTGRLPTPVLLQVLPVMLQTQKHTHQHHTQAVCELLPSLW